MSSNPLNVTLIINRKGVMHKQVWRASSTLETTKVGLLYTLLQSGVTKMLVRPCCILKLIRWLKMGVGTDRLTMLTQTQALQTCSKTGWAGRHRLTFRHMETAKRLSKVEHKWKRRCKQTWWTNKKVIQLISNLACLSLSKWVLKPCTRCD